MEELSIVIHGRPASKKNSRRNFGHVSLPSKAFLRFREDALWQLKKYKPKEPIGECEISYVFYQKGRLKQDPDNAIASVNDVLQDAEIIVDDADLMDGKWKIIRGSADWKSEIKIVYLRTHAS